MRRDGTLWLFATKGPLAETGNHDMSAWRVYGLDRITSLKVTDVPFKMPKDFDVERIFSQSYGIYFPRPGQKPVTIRFKVTDEEARYLRDLPVHRSQVEEARGQGRRKNIQDPCHSEP